MTTDLATEAVRMAEAFGLVAAGAIPIGGVAGLMARRPVFGRWRPPGETWTGAEILALFGLFFVFTALAAASLSVVGLFERLYGPGFPAAASEPLNDAIGSVAGGPAAATVAARRAEADQLRFLWATLFTVPLFLATAAVVWSLGRERWPQVEWSEWPGRVATGVAAWGVLTPIVFGVHFLTSVTAEALGVSPEDHPLTRVPMDGTGRDAILFAVIVCGLTPLAEEFLFRGTLLGWAMKRRVRPAILLAVGAVLGGLQGGLFESPPRWGAAVFAAVLVVGMAGLNRWRVYPPRTGNAIYATAAVFALVHSSVWPTPIPLFVLGLGLGYVSARTRGIAACVVAHGLFNAVSFVYLIRGGAGL